MDVDETGSVSAEQNSAAVRDASLQSTRANELRQAEVCALEAEATRLADIESLRAHNLRQAKVREENKRKAEKRALELESERFHDVKVDLMVEIELFIRTQKGFDSRNPTKYLCPLSTMSLDPDMKSTLDDLNNQRYNLTLASFISKYCNETIVSHRQDTKFSVKYLTPFQGEPSHRVFGHFMCSKCGGRWQSGATWANKWQQCKRCESKIYPFFQHPLEKAKEDDRKATDTRKPHDMARCQRCCELGRICVPSQYYSA